MLSGVNAVPTQTILVVDDSAVQRSYVSAILSRHGFEIATASTGAEGLAKARENPDLIILDVSLPDLDGREVCRRLRADPEMAAMPILHLSASAVETEDRVEGLESGADTYLVYPIDPGLLVATVRALLRIRQAQEEQRKLEARTLEEQKLASLAVMASGIAHDFSNILQAVLGYAELAGTSLPEDSQAAEDVRAIRDSSLRAAELVGKILDYSGSALTPEQQLRLPGLVCDFRDFLAADIAHGVTVQYELDADTADIQGNPGQIEQVLVNLVTNAVEALTDAERGDSAGQITVRTGVMEADDEYLGQAHGGYGLPPGPYAFLEVADDGPGIAPDAQGRVFDPFFTTRFTGRGLGLSSAAGIARAHRGAIRLDSAPGAGATFRVLFPVSPVVSESRAPTAEPADAAAAEARVRAVVLAEPNSAVRRIASRMLESFGLTVREAATLPAVSELLASPEETADLVLVDLSTSEAEAACCVQQVVQRQPEVGIIVTSAANRERAAEHVTFGDRVVFLQKPHNRSALRQAFDSLKL